MGSTHTPWQTRRGRGVTVTTDPTDAHQRQRISLDLTRDGQLSLAAHQTEAEKHDASATRHGSTARSCTNRLSMKGSSCLLVRGASALSSCGVEQGEEQE